MAHQFKSKIALEHGESLLVFSKDGLGSIIDGPLKWMDVITEIDCVDSVTKVHKYDNYKMQGVDISEITAWEYLSNLDLKNELDLDEPFHPFIKESNSIVEFEGFVVAEKANNARFGSYEKQHRLRYREVA